MIDRLRRNARRGCPRKARPRCRGRCRETSDSPAPSPSTQTNASTPIACAMGCVLCSSKSQFIQSFYRGSLIRVAAKNAQQLGGGLRILTHTVAGGSDLFRSPCFQREPDLPGGKPSTLQDRGVGAISHDWFIRDDDRRARRERVVNFVRKLRIDPQARRDLLGIDAAAAARHGHPLARLAARSQ